MVVRQGLTIGVVEVSCIGGDFDHGICQAEVESQ